MKVRAYPLALCLLLAACRPSPSATPLLTPSTTPLPPPAATATPTLSAACTPRLVPQATGEKYSEVVIKAAPPAQARPGEGIVVELAEGYGLIGHIAQVCGQDQVVGYVYADELPSFNLERQVQVYLDSQPWQLVRCGQVCRLELVVPAGTPPGEHLIRVIFPGVRQTLFAIQVIGQ